jgi:hypothetical protein
MTRWLKPIGYYNVIVIAIALFFLFLIIFEVIDSYTNQKERMSICIQSCNAINTDYFESNSTSCICRSLANYTNNKMEYKQNGYITLKIPTR